MSVMLKEREKIRIYELQAVTVHGECITHTKLMRALVLFLQILVSSLCMHLVVVFVCHKTMGKEGETRLKLDVTLRKEGNHSGLSRKSLEYNRSSLLYYSYYPFPQCLKVYHVCTFGLCGRLLPKFLQA